MMFDSGYAFSLSENDATRRKSSPLGVAAICEGLRSTRLGSVCHNSSWFLDKCEIKQMLDEVTSHAPRLCFRASDLAGRSDVLSVSSRSAFTATAGRSNDPLLFGSSVDDGQLDKDVSHETPRMGLSSASVDDSRSIVAPSAKEVNRTHSKDEVARGGAICPSASSRTSRQTSSRLLSAADLRRNALLRHESLVEEKIRREVEEKRSDIASDYFAGDAARRIAANLSHHSSDVSAELADLALPDLNERFETVVKPKLLQRQSLSRSKLPRASVLVESQATAVSASPAAVESPSVGADFHQEVTNDREGGRGDSTAFEEPKPESVASLAPLKATEKQSASTADAPPDQAMPRALAGMVQAAGDLRSVAEKLEQLLAAARKSEADDAPIANFRANSRLILAKFGDLWTEMTKHNFAEGDAGSREKQSETWLLKVKQLVGYMIQLYQAADTRFCATNGHNGNAAAAASGVGGRRLSVTRKPSLGHQAATQANVETATIVQSKEPQTAAVVKPRRLSAKRAAEPAVKHTVELTHASLPVSTSVLPEADENQPACCDRLQAAYKAVADAQQMLDFFSQPEMKSVKFALSKAINQPLNAVANAETLEHLEHQYQRLFALFAGEAVDVGASKPVSLQIHPHAPEFCKILMAKQILQQAEKVVSVHPEVAFPLATVTVGIWADCKSFGDLLLDYLCAACPCFSVCANPNPEYHKVEGIDNFEKTEDLEAYLSRMTGLGRLFGALTITPCPSAPAVRSKTFRLPSAASQPPPNRQHPLGVDKAWELVNSLARTPPAQYVTATILHEILKTTGFVLQAKFGDQFEELLRRLKALFQAYPAKAGAHASYVKLELLISEHNFVKPEGFTWLR